MITVPGGNGVLFVLWRTTACSARDGSREGEAEDRRRDSELPFRRRSTCLYDTRLQELVMKAVKPGQACPPTKLKLRAVPATDQW